MSLWDDAVHAVCDVTSDVTDAAKKVQTGVDHAAKDIFNGALNAAKSTISGDVKGLTGAASQIGQGAASAVSDISQGQFQKGLSDFGHGLQKGAETGTSSVWHGLTTGAGQAWHGLDEGAHDLVSGIKGAAKDVAHGFDATEKLVQDGAHDVERVIKGAESDFQALQALFSPPAQDKLLRQSVNQLKYNGDQTALSISASGKVTADPLGGQGQDTASITIKQVGGANAPGMEGQPVKPKTYQVTLTETHQAGVNEGVTGSIPDVPVKLSGGAQIDGSVTTSVTLTFNSKQDAENAAKSLLKVAGIDNAEAAAETAINPASQVSSAVSFDNPILQTIDRGGAGGMIQKVLSHTPLSPLVLSGSESSFLQGHISSYSTTLTASASAQGSASVSDLQKVFPFIAKEQGAGKVLSMLDAGAGVTGTASDAVSITRTVTKAQGSTPPTVAYTASNLSTLSGNASIKMGVKLPFLKDLNDGKNPTLKVSGPGIGGTLSAQESVTATYDLKAGETGNPGGGLQTARSWDDPNQLQTKLQLQSSPFSDGGVLPYKNATVHTDTIQAGVENPAEHDRGQVMNFLLTPFSGNVNSAIQDEKQLGAGASYSITDTGASATSTAKFALDPSIGLGDIGISAGINVNITNTLLKSEHVWPQPPEKKAEAAPRIASPSTPQQHEVQYTVLPQSGLNIRSDASTHARKLDAIFNGSFVEATGATKTDAQHNLWRQVNATGMDGRHVTGWVEAQYIAPHPQGSLDGAGRIDRDRELGGYIPHVVQQGENLSEIAARYGVNLAQIENSNGQHIIDPSLIFPGDEVYIPSSVALKPGANG